MNTNTALKIGKAIYHDLSDLGILNGISNLAQYLQQMVSNPGHAIYQQQFSDQKKSLFELLDKASTNNLNPRDKISLTEMGIDNKLGSILKIRIQKEIDDNSLTPSNLAQSLTAIVNELNLLNQYVTGLIAGIEGLLSAKENQVDYEIGLLIPNRYTKNTLDSLISELDDFGDIYKTFEEVCTGQRTNLKYTSLSNSDPYVTFESVGAVCACVAVAIERIIQIYKTVLEVRELRNKLKEQGITDGELTAIDDNANRRIESGIEELIPDLLSNFLKKDIESGRVNELKIELRHNLKKIAVKIDNGFFIEAKVNKQEKEENVEMSEQEKQEIANIKKSSLENNYINKSGQRILKIEEKKVK
jgi:hypothetical protein